jgi:hypothetical protein
MEPVTQKVQKTLDLDSIFVEDKTMDPDFVEFSRQRHELKALLARVIDTEKLYASSLLTTVYDASTQDLSHLFTATRTNYHTYLRSLSTVRSQLTRMNHALQRHERLHSAQAPLKVSTGEMKPEEWELSM